MKFAALLHVVLLASPVRGSAASFSLGCVEMDAPDGNPPTYAVSFEDAEEEAKEAWNNVFFLDSDNTAATNLKVAYQSYQAKDGVALVVSEVGSEKGAKSPDKSLEKCNTIAAEMNKNLKRRAPDAPLFSGVCKPTTFGIGKGKKHNVLVFNNQTDCEESTKILEYLMKDHFCSVRFGPDKTQHCSGHGTCVDHPDLKDYACTCNAATADTPYCDWSDTTGCSIVGNNCQFTYARTRKGEKSIMAMIDSDRNFYESFDHNDTLVESVMSRYGWVNLTALVDVHVLKDGTPTPVSKGKRITNGAHGITFTFKANGLKPPGEFLINPTNGYMLAIPGQPVDPNNESRAVKSAEYEVQVFGQRTDGSGTLTEFELETLKLNILESVDFTCELKDPNNESREGGHVINRHTNNASSCEMSPEGTCVYTFGESYSFGEIEKTRGEEEFLWDAEACDGRSGPESCRPAMEKNTASIDDDIAHNKIWFTLDKSPPGFLLNGMTGEMQGVPKENGSFDLLIYAWYGLDKKSAIPFINTTMEVRYKDTDLPEILGYSDDRLPNCNDDNTDELDDGVKFDQTYTCKCKDDWGGPTCNERTEEYLNSEASAAARGDNMAYALGGAGGLLGMILIVFVGYKVNAYRIKMKPADFDTLFQAMVASGEIDPEEAAKCVTVLQAAHKKEKERPKARRRSTAASLAPLSEAPAGDGHVVDKDGYLMPGKTSASAEDAQVVNEYTDFGFGGADEEPAKK
eukprot:gene8503-30819_t